MRNDPDVTKGILQFEYARPVDGIYWDLSDLDGVDANVAGSPFRSDNVRVTPETPALGTGTCNEILCPAHIVCNGSYQNPNDELTRHCPPSTDRLLVDLCIPDAIFEAKT